MKEYVFELSMAWFICVIFPYIIYLRYRLLTRIYPKGWKAFFRAGLPLLGKGRLPEEKIQPNDGLFFWGSVLLVAIWILFLFLTLK